MPEYLVEFLTLTNLLNVFLYSFGVWIPVYITYRYHLRAERRKEKAFNKNTLILLLQELDVIRSVNERIRKSSHRIVEACKEENRLVFDEFPHRLDTKTLESLIANLVLYRGQNPKLLRYLIELKSNLQVTNESLGFGMLKTFVDNNSKKMVGNTVEGYFEGVFKYLKANFEFLQLVKEEAIRSI